MRRSCHVLRNSVPVDVETAKTTWTVFRLIGRCRRFAPRKSCAVLEIVREEHVPNCVDATISLGLCYVENHFRSTVAIVIARIDQFPVSRQENYISRKRYVIPLIALKQLKLGTVHVVIDAAVVNKLCFHNEGPFVGSVRF